MNRREAEIGLTTQDQLLDRLRWIYVRTLGGLRQISFFDLRNSTALNLFTFDAMTRRVGDLIAAGIAGQSGLRTLRRESREHHMGLVYTTTSSTVRAIHDIPVARGTKFTVLPLGELGVVARNMYRPSERLELFGQWNDEPTSVELVRYKNASSGDILDVYFLQLDGQKIASVGNVVLNDTVQGRIAHDVFRVTEQ